MDQAELQQKRADLAAVMQEYRGQLKVYEEQLLQTMREYEVAMEKIRVKQIQESFQ